MTPERKAFLLKRMRNRNDKVIYKDAKERVKYSSIKKNYGLSRIKYDNIFNAQGGKCAICNTDGRELCVDHDHTTGKVRGLLCHRCNFALGYLDYLGKHIGRAMGYFDRRFRGLKF